MATQPSAKNDSNTHAHGYAPLVSCTAMLLAIQSQGAQVGLVWALPFVLMLGSIAIIPFISHTWWERRYPWVALVLATVGLGYYVVVRRDLGPWLHEMEDYVSFIIVMAALYTVSSSLVIHVNRRATPLVNVLVLLAGALLANILGTTGAAMLLIRPYLRMNRGHLRPYHAVFFIFLVANVGGCLTPIGDPPLFFGYLAGVPFWWTLHHCWAPWLFTVALLLAIYWVIDSRSHRKQSRAHPEVRGRGYVIHVDGWRSIPFIAIVVGAFFLPGTFAALGTMLAPGGLTIQRIAALLTSREVVLIAAALASWRLTKPGVHEQNEYSTAAIREVAILFAAIFSTLGPVIEYLGSHAAHLPVRSPGQYYLGAGLLSSVLDNAPTYAVFLQLRLSQVGGTTPGMMHLPAMLQGDPALAAALRALSLGAVFFGACTYIGNGPNFMVRSLVEHSGQRMPGFFTYAWRYALPILGPVYLLVWLLFLR